MDLPSTIGFTLDPCIPDIRLLVGRENPTIVNVHQGLLCKISQYFRNAFKEEWCSQREDPHALDLYDESLETVKAYVNWLYSGKMPLAYYRPAAGTSYEIVAQGAEKKYMILAAAYVFGNKILDVAFKNAIIDGFVATNIGCQWSPGPESASIIYNGTCPGSSARRLLSDFVAYSAWNDSHLEIGWMSMIDGYHPELLMGAMKKMVKLRSKNKPQSRDDPCHHAKFYHDN